MSDFTADDEGFVSPPLQIIAERQRSMARSVGDLLKWRNGRDGMDSWRGVTDERILALIDETKTIKKMLLGLIFTTLAGFTTVAISVYLSTGGTHP